MLGRQPDLPHRLGGGRPETLGGGGRDQLVVLAVDEEQRSRRHGADCLSRLEVVEEELQRQGDRLPFPRRPLAHPVAGHVGLAGAPVENRHRAHVARPEIVSLRVALARQLVDRLEHVGAAEGSPDHEHAARVRLGPRGQVADGGAQAPRRGGGRLANGGQALEQIPVGRPPVAAIRVVEGEQRDPRRTGQDLGGALVRADAAEQEHGEPLDRTGRVRDADRVRRHVAQPAFVHGSPFVGEANHAQLVGTRAKGGVGDDRGLELRIGATALCATPAAESRNDGDEGDQEAACGPHPPDGRPPDKYPPLR